MRKFTAINFMTGSVPDETTLCKFRHLLEEYGLNKLFFDAINRRPGSFARVSDKAINWERHIEYLKSSVRCRAEHVFRIIKCQFGYRKTVYCGFSKNKNRLHAMFACANLYALARAAQRLSAAWRGKTMPFWYWAVGYMDKIAADSIYDR